MINGNNELELFDLSEEYLKKSSISEISNIEKAIRELRSLIQFHEWKYYVRNDPVVSDFEFDKLYSLLVKLEEANPLLVSHDSPTQRVSSDLSEGFSTVPHLAPMLSLANSYDAESLFEFDRQMHRWFGISDKQEIAYCVEPKFDGGSVGLVYSDDQLIRAATRGDGIEGDEITSNIKTIRSIPLSASFSRYGIKQIELRGEAIIRKDIFRFLNEQRATMGLPLFANPRNAATGALRMKDPKETAERRIEVFIYQISYLEMSPGYSGSQIKTQWDGIKLLDELGFKVPQSEKKLCRNIEEVILFCAEWENKRDEYPYEIDGMVIKVNDLVFQGKVGSTSHHPRWAIAYKFKARQATSTLKRVDFHVGKTGSITPVAKLDPVHVGGVTVSSVSLHNEDFIRSKDLHIGDRVLVERAGDVIPYIVKALPELRRGDEVAIQFPKYCPVDPEHRVLLIREEEESAWRCPECLCGAQDLQKMIFHVSKDAMDIDGLGGSMIERFYQLGWLRSLADIYRLDYEKIALLDGFGEKSALNIQKAIEKAKHSPIHRVLHSLSIPLLGKRTSKLIAEHISHILELKDWTVEDLTGIRDIGPVLAGNIVRFFKDQKNVTMIRDMESLRVNLTATEADKSAVVKGDTPLTNQTVLFTGALQSISRKEAQALAEEAGAKIASGVSSKLNILVVGENPGSKLEKAKTISSIEVLTEGEFLQRLKTS